MFAGSLVKYMDNNPGWFIVELDHYMPDLRWYPKPKQIAGGGGP